MLLVKMQAARKGEAGGGRYAGASRAARQRRQCPFAVTAPKVLRYAVPRGAKAIHVALIRAPRRGSARAIPLPLT